jgi:TIR domain
VAQIFLSYAREDEAQVRDVYHRLRGAGFEVWMDKINLPPGQRWKQEIPRAIRESDFILIFFWPVSSDPNSSEQFDWLDCRSIEKRV